MDGINWNPGRQFDGSELSELIDEYLRDSASRVAAATHKDYSAALEYFRRWWNGVGPSQGYVVHRSDFQEFLRWLEVQPSRQGERLGVGTVDTVIKRLKQFFRWAWVEEFFNRDYSKWIPKPNGTPPEHIPPDPECLELLFAAAGMMEKPVRNRAILAILIGTAVRRAECANIDIEHIQFYADGGGQIAVVKGKNSKHRTVIFDAVTGDFINAHLRYMVDAGHTSGPLFLGRKGRLTPKALYDVVVGAADRAGLADKLQGPHDLRRMFATHWARKQRGDGFAQPLSLQMGHTDRKMTLQYTKQDLSDVKLTFTSPMERLPRRRPSG